MAGTLVTMNALAMHKEHFSILLLFKSPCQPSSVPQLPLPLSLCLWSGNILPTEHCSLVVHFVLPHPAGDLPAEGQAVQLAEAADPINIHKLK